MADTSLNSNTSGGPLYVGVDVGGTNIKVGLVDDSGNTLVKKSIPTQQERGPEDAMQRVSEIIRQLVAEAGVDDSAVVGVGLATPGTMDLVNGILLYPHNLPTWQNTPIRDCLQNICGKPVTFGNDANAAAYGEFWIGSGSEFNSMALFTLGTGVGGGIIIGDILVEGEHSAGSEMGHTVIDYNDTARQCGCGQVGHLEAYASAKAVVARTRELMEAGRATSLARRIDEGAKLTPKLVAEEAEKGDDLSLEIVIDTGKYLAIGIVNVMHTVDPGAIILGGAMNFGGHGTQLGERFLGAVREEAYRRCFPALAETTKIDFAKLGGDAGYVGAAGMARLTYLKSRNR